MLAHKREREGLSMRQAASSAGVGTNTYFRAEHGGGVRSDAMLKLATWVGVPPVVLGDTSANALVEVSVADMQALDALTEAVNSSWRALGGEGEHPSTPTLDALRQRWASSSR